MVSFDGLEVEILAIIFEFVDDTSPKTTGALARVNKLFYATSKLVRHRHKTVGYTERQRYCDDADVTGWLQNDEVLRGLRYLTVETRNPTLHEKEDGYGNADVKWNNFVALIEKLGNLKLLVWNHDSMIPLSVLEALHKHQSKAELQMYNFQRNKQEADHNDPAEIALAHSPALTAIKASFRENGGRPDLRDACFRRIVANAPNIRFASLSRWRSGCVVYSLTPEQQMEKEKLEQLFYTHTKPSGSLRRLTLDGYGLSDDLLEDWSTTVDLSHLENIKCSSGAPDVSYFRYAPQVLTNLKHVSLNFGYLSAEDKNTAAVVETYLTTINPLKTLSLWSWMDKIDLSTLLARHGQSLRTLQLHERETAGIGGRKKRGVLRAVDVKAIAEACPNLQDLCIDCDRHSKELDTEIEVDEVLHELAKMKLNKMQIYYDLGLAHMANETWGENMVDSDSADEDEDEDENEDEDGDVNKEDGSDEESDPASTAQAANASVVTQTTHQTSTGATTVTTASPKKEVRKEPLPPSTFPEMETYVKKLWKYMFSDRTTARHLNVKFGEWERKMPNGYPASWVMEESRLKTYWLVRPEERDDMLGECKVEVHGTSVPKRP